MVRWLSMDCAFATKSDAPAEGLPLGSGTITAVDLFVGGATTLFFSMKLKGGRAFATDS